MMKREVQASPIIFLKFCILLFAIPAITGCENRSAETLCFAFIGDLHYAINDSTAAGNIVCEIAGEMKDLERKPDFIIQTGDFFHAGRGVNIASEAEMAFNHFRRDIGIPFFISRGNHDSKVHFEKNALPLFSRQLGREIDKSYYSFRRGNCHFIMLDSGEKDLQGMLSWLGQELRSASSDPAVEHIFVAGHEPLWIVARAGFTNQAYAKAVSALISEYKTDCYFCGHTHNKTVTVRLIDGRPVTQLMDAAVVEKGRLSMLAPMLDKIRTEPWDSTDPGILPLEEAHQIFIPESQLKYYYGYQEGSSASYYIINVRGDIVQADWHVKGKGVVRSFMWKKPGELKDMVVPERKKGEPVGPGDYKKIEMAWLYAAPWILTDSLSAPFTINNVPAGRIEITRKGMAYSPFWNKVEISIDKNALSSISRENEIIIANPAGKEFGLAHLFILVKFSDGRFARTNIASRVITSFVPQEKRYSNFPDQELLETVTPGNSLAPVKLIFDNYY